MYELRIHTNIPAAKLPPAVARCRRFQANTPELADHRRRHMLQLMNTSGLTARLLVVPDVHERDAALVVVTGAYSLRTGKCLDEHPALVSARVGQVHKTMRVLGARTWKKSWPGRLPLGRKILQLTRIHLDA